jgi:hypothetical protein
MQWEAMSLQLPPSRLRQHVVKTTVRLHVYPDARMAVFWDRTDWATTTPRGS